MRYEILGPLRVTRDGEEYSLSAHKTEILFAVLLVRANQVVSADQLLTELWDGELPHRACAGLYVYISQLRKFLTRIGKSKSPIQTRSPGYLLNVGPEEFDLFQFQRAVMRGRRQTEAGQAAEGARSLEEGLALWRGMPLGGLRGGPIVRGFAIWLEEARLECIELLVKAQFLEGRHAEVVTRLYSLIADYPLRESFYQMLMLALYRSNRPADALRVYQQARARIIEEIGLEPSRAMRDLHQAILLDDAELARVLP